MTNTQKLVVVGSAINCIVAAFAFYFNLELSSGVILGITVVWLIWAFTGDRG
jgi:hypothetical protein